MDYNIKISNIAKDDIDKAIGYIALKINNVEAARKLRDKINVEVDKLKKNPFITPSNEIYGIIDANSRHINIDNYVLVFEIDIEMKIISVDRFLYGKSDIKNKLH